MKGRLLAILPLLATTVSCHLLFGHSAAERPPDAADMGKAPDHAVASDRAIAHEGKAPDLAMARDLGKAPDQAIVLDKAKLPDQAIVFDKTKPPDKGIALDTAPKLDAPPKGEGIDPGCSCKTMLQSCSTTCSTRTVQCSFAAGAWNCSCTTSHTTTATFPISPAFTGCQACDYAANVGFDEQCAQLL